MRKHKISAYTYSSFNQIYEDFKKKIQEFNFVIVDAKFNLDDTGVLKAVIWTKRKKESDVK